MAQHTTEEHHLMVWAPWKLVTMAFAFEGHMLSQKQCGFILEVVKLALNTTFI